MPENQNMQKTSDNEAMLQEIVQNTEMGKNLSLIHISEPTRP